jgi:hypothetical protein
MNNLIAMLAESLFLINNEGLYCQNQYIYLYTFRLVKKMDYYRYYISVVTFVSLCKDLSIVPKIKYPYRYRTIKLICNRVIMDLNPYVFYD